MELGSRFIQLSFINIASDRFLPPLTTKLYIYISVHTPIAQIVTDHNQKCSPEMHSRHAAFAGKGIRRWDQFRLGQEHNMAAVVIQY